MIHLSVSSFVLMFGADCRMNSDCKVIFILKTFHWIPMLYIIQEKVFGFFKQYFIINFEIQEKVSHATLEWFTLSDKF